MYGKGPGLPWPGAYYARAPDGTAPGLKEPQGAGRRLGAPKRRLFIKSRKGVKDGQRPCAILVASQDLEVGFGVGAGRAKLGRLLPVVDVPAVAAAPGYGLGLFEEGAVLDVLEIG